MKINDVKLLQHNLGKRVGVFWDLESVDMRYHSIVNKFINNWYKNCKISKKLFTSPKNNYRFYSLNRKRGYEHFSAPFDHKNAADFALLSNLIYSKNEYDVIIIVSNDKIYSQTLKENKRIIQFYTHKDEISNKNSNITFHQLHNIFKR